ncbi:MAG: hypothetical protein Fur0046_06230 [Cyanobacteria bacterium J069]
MLSQLPDKPPECSVREAIALLQDAIHAALDKGYSREDIAGLLNEAGIPISAPSLRYYLTRLKQAERPLPQTPSAQLKALRSDRSNPKQERSPARSAAALTSPPSSPSPPTNAAQRSVENVIAYLLDETPRSLQSPLASQDVEADRPLAPVAAANSSAESAPSGTPPKRKKQKR